MQIPILSGTYTDEDGDYRTSYPRNLIPVPKDTGVSQGYLRPADGIVELTQTNGLDRGGYNWSGEHYRVIGSSLVHITKEGVITTKGNVAGTDTVIFKQSFDYLSISGGGSLYLFKDDVLKRITDPDIGNVVAHIWVDGYFMTTDGEFIAVTELNNPFEINPLKYGSAEADPDPIRAILKIRNEPVALNRYTTEVFDNVGGTLFPFQRIEGAQMMRGTIGAHSCAVYMEALAFLGSGRNEPLAVWIGANSQTVKISTREVDQIIQSYAENDLTDTIIEVRKDLGHDLLYVHLPDQTLVYDGAASRVMQTPVWFTLVSSKDDLGQYQFNNMVWVHDRWIGGDPTASRIGYFTDKESTHYGKQVSWEFNTKIVYNQGGAIFHELELIALTGRTPLGVDPTVWTSYSDDGEAFSVEIPLSAGIEGERSRRLIWTQNGYMDHTRIQRFRGTSDTHISPSRLEARLEALSHA